MKIVQKKQRLFVTNMDEESAVGKSCYRAQRHRPLLPSSVRSIIVRPFNCGKTNAMMALLTDPNVLRFEKVYVYSKSLYQPKYEYLKTVLQPIKGIGYHTFK